MAEHDHADLPTDVVDRLNALSVQIKDSESTRAEYYHMMVREGDACRLLKGEMMELMNANSVSEWSNDEITDFKLSRVLTSKPVPWSIKLLTTLIKDYFMQEYAMDEGEADEKADEMVHWISARRGCSHIEGLVTISPRKRVIQ